MAGANTTLEVLIVEDTLSMALMYQQHLKRAGIKSHICQSGTLALTELRKGHVETVLLDLQLPDMNGLDLIKEMEGTDHNISFIVITANGSVNAAVDAMRAGAYDFLIKPFPTEKLLTTVKNALDRPKIKAKGKVLKTSLAKIEAPGFVGESKPMLEVYNMIENVANSNAAVFITGESGTGKEVTAQAIHNRNPMVEVAEKRFREDLFYRLDVLSIELPPLSHRGKDVILLAESFLETYAAEEGKHFKSISPEAQTLMLEYHWPGNIRELQNAVRKAAVVYDGVTLEPHMLSLNTPHAVSKTDDYKLIGAVGGPKVITPQQSLKTMVSVDIHQPMIMIEKEIIEAVIASCKGSIPKASQILQLSPSTIYRKREVWIKQDLLFRYQSISHFLRPPSVSILNCGFRVGGSGQS